MPPGVQLTGCVVQPMDRPLSRTWLLLGPFFPCQLDLARMVYPNASQYESTRATQLGDWASLLLTHAISFLFHAHTLMNSYPVSEVVGTLL